MDINALVKLTSRAWSLKILALLHRGTPGRQAPLLAASGASRTAFSQSLAHLCDLGLLERNPGHGHPLRPEFRLTPTGVEMAAVADRILSAVPQSPGTTLLRRTWTVPILAVTQTPRHFSEIKGTLSSISDRALSLSLQQLQAQQWLKRSISAADRPPRTRYRAINAGASIGQAVNWALPASF